MTAASEEPLVVDEFTCAKRLKLSVAWLRRDRRNEQIVPFIKLNSAVRYDLDQVRAALRARQQGGSGGA